MPASVFYSLFLLLDKHYTTVNVICQIKSSKFANIFLAVILLDYGVTATSPIRDVLQYACGVRKMQCLVLTENSTLKMGYKVVRSKNGGEKKRKKRNIFKYAHERHMAARNWGELFLDVMVLRK